MATLDPKSTNRPTAGPWRVTAANGRSPAPSRRKSRVAPETEFRLTVIRRQRQRTAKRRFRSAPVDARRKIARAGATLGAGAPVNPGQGGRRSGKGRGSFWKGLLPACTPMCAAPANRQRRRVTQSSRREPGGVQRAKPTPTARHKPTRRGGNTVHSVKLSSYPTLSPPSLTAKDCRAAQDSR
jgi:hypothetical protein